VCVLFTVVAIVRFEIVFKLQRNRRSQKSPSPFGDWTTKKECAERQPNQSRRSGNYSFGRRSERRWGGSCPIHPLLPRLRAGAQRPHPKETPLRKYGYHICKTESEGGGCRVIQRWCISIMRNKKKLRRRKCIVCGLSRHIPLGSRMCKKCWCLPAEERQALRAKKVKRISVWTIG